jgi:hypothetical protein
MPLSDLSINVKTEIISLVETRTAPTASIYSPENSFYLITFPDTQTTYCFDLKGRLENGGYRVTRWTSAPFKSYERKTDGTLLVGTNDGIGEYAGYTDEYNDAGTITPSSYRFRYYSPGLTFGDPAKTKLLKKIRPTLVGANSATVFIKWAYDFGTTYSTQEFTVGNQVPYYFNEPASEYTVAEFTGGTTTTRPPVNTTGGGSIITIGLESEINGFALSLQEINVLALMGKTI